MESKNQRNVKWVEGLRGITSALVITTHIARAWDFPLFWPADAPETAPRLLQLPIFRIPFQGRIGVPIFAFLTGFVCAYKPLRLAYQQGNAPAALHSVSRSAFRRVPRLVLPATIATLMSFALSVLGAYRTANQCDSFWVRFDAPDPVATLGEEIRRLFHTLLTTWTSTENLYDRHQWAMRPLLVGAFQVYVTLAATIGMRFRYRVIVHALLMAYWLSNPAPLTETFGANLALGTLIAELSIHRPTQNFIASHHRMLSYVVTPLFMFVGLWIGSYPHEHEDWAAWSMQMNKLFVDPLGDRTQGTFVVPLGADPQRRMSSAMIQICAISMFLSPLMREALSHRWLLWLGNHSFAVYLVHGSILRTVGMWIVYGFAAPWQPPPAAATAATAAATPAPSDPPPESGEVIPPPIPDDQMFLHAQSNFHKGFAVIVVVALTYAAAWAWMKYVDSACARATAWLENKVFDADDDDDDAAEKGSGGRARAPSHSHTRTESSSGSGSGTTPLLDATRAERNQLPP